MLKRKFNSLHVKYPLFCLFALLFFVNPLVAKPKKSKGAKDRAGQVKDTFDGNKPVEDPQPVQEIVVEEPVVVVEQITEDFVKLPSQKPTFFSKIESEILEGVENGSPESIKTAMQKLRKPDVEYSEAEKVLINIATEFMTFIWSSEKITWETPEIFEENPYTGAIASANKGVFDSSTGNTDFLSILLPAVVIFRQVRDVSVYEQCNIAIQNALEKNPDSVVANYMQGYVYEKMDMPENALMYYKIAYMIAPSSQEIALSYGQTLRLTGDYENAAKVLASIQNATTDLKVLKQNAYLAFAAGDIPAAEEYVARVLQQNPNNLEFVLFRAKILVEKNDYIHAVSLLDVYARQDSDSLDYLLLRSKVQLDWSKNPAGAAENVEKALHLYPNNTDALMMAARISSMIDAPVAGKYADELAAKVLEKDPHNQDAMLYALNGLMQRENWQEAYDISKKLVLTQKVSPEIIEKHVQICVNLDRKSEAYDFASKELALYPENEVVQQAYIYAFSKTGSRDSVVKYIDSQISASTTSSKMKSYLYYRRSFLQFSEDAILADLRSSLISNPRNSDSLFRLYEIYFDKSDYRKAQYYLRQVVAINPNDNSVKQLNDALTKLMQ